LAVRKSKKSKIVLAKILHSTKIPKDNEAKIDIREIKMNKIKQALARETPIRSVKDDTGTSKILIPEVIAANNNNTKKAIATISP